MVQPTYKNRISKVRKLLEDKSLDGILVTKRENCRYLSGFTGTSAWLVITGTEAFLITDFRYVEQAGIEAPDYKLVKYEESYEEEIKRIFEGQSVKSAGFEDQFVTFSQYRSLKNKVKTVEWVPLGNEIDQLRHIKDEYELDQIRKAISISDAAFTHILPYIKPGVSEKEIASEIEHFMRCRGASGPSFETIVASGYRAALPHGVASEKKINAGDTVVLDYGCVYNGYCSDITRTVFVGTKDFQMEKIYNIVLEAQKAAEEKIRAGITGKEGDSYARSYIEAAGYGEKFGHGLGHGVGLEIHEEPRLSPKYEGIISEGSVVTVEPGIYLEGIGGVRIEDCVLVKKDGVEVITSATKELMVL